MQKKLPGLYPIVNLEDHDDAIDFIQKLFTCGVKIIQTRDKVDRERLLKQTTEAVNLARRLETKDNLHRIIIVNDDAEICNISKADGLHIGQDDVKPSDARDIIGHDKILGLSTHSLEHIAKSPFALIDYFGFGPIFPSPTKVCSITETGLELLAKACNASPLPIVAIGGISLARAKSVYEAGAASIAVISALTNAKDLATTINEFENAYQGSARC